ncbi:tyrosine-type recombinase/integrase [Ruegeria sp. HKCCA5426]|uniref:tyrosine-type recombinase/integrase n=1 Tax=Ruegeria sp. HKCCA5426 TaxID=2682985 RepID=UPI0014890C9D|nr:tyrosine-type recombinase/integrase [Ruegeria sp. HKCCA5426]
MTSNVIPLSTAQDNTPKAKDANRFKFTKTALADAIAAAPAGGIVVFRDEEMTGLILRRQRRDWILAIERRINGRIFRHSLGDYTSATDLRRIRAEASDIMSAVRNGTFQTKAQKKAQAVKKGKVAKLDAMTMGEALADFIEKNPQVRASTIETYAHGVARLEKLERKPGDPDIVPFVIARSRKLIADLTLDDTRQMYDRMVETHAIGTANQTIRSIRAIWRFWSEEHPSGAPLPDDPIKGMTTRKGRIKRSEARSGAIPADRRKSWFDAAQAEATKRGFAGGTVRAVLLLFLTGLRRDEALALHWDEVDLEAGTITIPEERMKNGRLLSRPITAEMRKVLDAQRQFTGGKGWVFPASRGTGHLTDTRKTLWAVNKIADVTITNHDLRRTYIGTAETASVPSTAIKLLVGHALVDVTEQYAASMRPDLPKHADTIEAALLA